MSTNNQALREAAEKAILEEGETWWNEEQLASDYGLALHRPDAKFIAAANPAAVLALLNELEAADALNKHLELAIRKADGCSEALRRKAEAAEKRVAELEAHTVTVKLPMPYDINVAGEHIDWEKGDHFDRDEVIAALRAAGITVKGDSE